jgi:hypothetical protein
MRYNLVETYEVGVSDENTVLLGVAGKRLEADSVRFLAHIDKVLFDWFGCSCLVWKFRSNLRITVVVRLVK